MSRRLSLQFLLPIEGYEEDKIYENEDISLKIANLNQKPDDIYYRCLKVKSVYTSFDDIVKFVGKKYSLGEIHNVSMRTDYLGNREVEYAGKQYIVTKDEVRQLEKEHIAEVIYCNEFKYCDLSWFYTSIGTELVPEDVVIIDDKLIQKATDIFGYKSEFDLAKGIADVIEDDVNGEDKFIASLILAKEMARLIKGRAVLRYE